MANCVLAYSGGLDTSVILGWLMDEGYDPSFGARPLKRTIQQRLENPLAGKILAGEFSDGNTIKIDAKGQQFKFEKA